MIICKPPKNPASLAIVLLFIYIIATVLLFALYPDHIDMGAYINGVGTLLMAFTAFFALIITGSQYLEDKRLRRRQKDETILQNHQEQLWKTLEKLEMVKNSLSFTCKYFDYYEKYKEKKSEGIEALKKIVHAIDVIDNALNSDERLPSLVDLEKKIQEAVEYSEYVIDINMEKEFQESVQHSFEEINSMLLLFHFDVNKAKREEYKGKHEKDRLKLILELLHEKGCNRMKQYYYILCLLSNQIRAMEDVEKRVMRSNSSKLFVCSHFTDEDYAMIEKFRLINDNLVYLQ